MIKTVLMVLLFASGSFAQNSLATAPGATGCGADEIRFDVKTDKKQHPTPQPEPGKALVYVIGDSWNDIVAIHIGVPPTRFGVDGAWVGANGFHSYFFFPVDPGDHRLCTNMESLVKKPAKYSTAATSFTAEAGKTYYFRTKSADSIGELRLVSVDPAEAQVMIASWAFSSFHLKK